MDPMSRVTVPVTCPRCRREGLARLDLLGQRSRCKACRQEFRMTRHVHMGCPRCEALLRVPAGRIGQSITCPSCDASFVADPSQADGRSPRPYGIGRRRLVGPCASLRLQ